MQYADLYEEPMRVVSKTILKVQADLFLKFRVGNTWDVKRAIQEYENMASKDEAHESPAEESTPFPMLSSGNALSIQSISCGNFSY